MPKGVGYGKSKYKKPAKNKAAKKKGK